MKQGCPSPLPQPDMRNSYGPLPPPVSHQFCPGGAGEKTLLMLTQPHQPHVRPIPLLPPHLAGPPHLGRPLLLAHFRSQTLGRKGRRGSGRNKGIIGGRDGETGWGAHLASGVSHPLQCLGGRWESSEGLGSHFRSTSRILAPAPHHPGPTSTCSVAILSRGGGGPSGEGGMNWGGLGSTQRRGTRPLDPAGNSKSEGSRSAPSILEKS